MTDRDIHKTWYTIKEAADYLTIPVKKFSNMVKAGNCPPAAIPPERREEMLKTGSDRITEMMFQRKDLDDFLLKSVMSPSELKRFFKKVAKVKEERL